MSWEKQNNGNWCFICKPDEPYRDSLKRCIRDPAYTVRDEDWLAFLTFATDIIAKKLNPSGTEAPLGTSFRSESQVSSEVRSQNNE
ncbi:hypothetical protein D5P88_00155 [Salmonella enterica subsp. enterica]|nr:hypothetical protein [Salmonella enterica subsp. enterica]